MKKILTAIFITLIAVTLTGCEGYNQPQIGNEYYVKYTISANRPYQKFSNVTYADVNGRKTANDGYSASRWSMTIGPVRKGFRAYVGYGWGGGTCQIEVSKNNGPFAMKAQGENSVSYTIDF